MDKYIFLFFLMPLLIFSQKTSFSYEILNYESFKNEISNDDVLLFDVRTTDEFNSGHIEGSINIDFYDKKIFTEFFEKIEKSKPIFIYCRTGNRSKQSSELLKSIGFNSVFDLEGGYTNWISNKN
ncbi:MAG: rhodanese-like domain-containing protein [Flavobacteriaceae bacterium]|nr:rhodanese-like domain-containing protein [Flavobacteriaceae bacterium]